MITEQSQRPDFKTKRARMTSDWAILNGIFHSKIWGLLFTKFWQAVDKICIQFFQFNNSLLSLGWTAPTRINPGSMAGGGVIQTLVVCSLILALNSKLVGWKILSPFVAWFVVPAIPFFKTPEELQEMALVQIESQALLIYGGVFLLSSIIQIIRTWLGFANKTVTSRGVGCLYLLINKLIGKRVHVNEFAIYLLESIGVACVGGFLILEAIDPCFGGWLVAISLAEIRILLFEKTAQIQNRRLLDA